MLPLLFIVPAALTGIAGIGKNIKAVVDVKEASDIRDKGNVMANTAAECLEKRRIECKNALESLGKIKLCILESSIKSFLYLFEQLKNVDFVESEGLRELRKMHIDQKEFEEIKSVKNVLGSIAEGVVAGAGSGALTAIGAYSAAMAFGTASTGTAIGTLSGAAATNATLAFFGGGSLAAGGLGMAGGTMVLGGLVAGPALLVMGLITGAKAGTELEHAKTSYAEIEKACAEMMAGCDECIAIRRRSYMFYNLLARLDSRLMPLIFRMEDIIKKEGVDYSHFCNESKKIIAETAALAGTVKAVIDTPILKEDGALTDESKIVFDATLKEMTGQY